MEVSLVVDLSGSMAFCAAIGSPDSVCANAANSRLTALKKAAKVFIGGVFKSPFTLEDSGTKDSNGNIVWQKQYTEPMTTDIPADNVVVSLVPFTQQVNLGPVLGPRFNFSTEHTVSYCADFLTADYSNVTITPTTALTRSVDAEVRSTGISRDFVECARQLPGTPSSTIKHVVPFSNKPDVLRVAVDGFVAAGATSTDIGAKWGVALLDNAVNPIVKLLIASGDVDAALTKIPVAYDTFEPGAANELVVIRAGIKLKPFFPTAGLGLRLSTDGTRTLQAGDEIGLRQRAEGVMELLRKIGSWCRLLRRRSRSERGSLTVEAVLMLPFLLWWYMASFQYFEAFAQRSINIKAAYTITDRITRERGYVKDAYIAGMGSTFDYLTSSRDPTWIRVTSVKWDAGESKFTVHWSYATRSNVPRTTETLQLVRGKIPTMSPSDSVILVETFSSFEPVFRVGLESLTFDQFVVMPPRFQISIVKVAD